MCSHGLYYDYYSITQFYAPRALLRDSLTYASLAPNSRVNFFIFSQSFYKVHSLDRQYRGLNKLFSFERGDAKLTS